MGAGHDGAAAELCDRLEAAGIETERVDFLDAAPVSGWAIKSVYEAWLRWTPWAYEATYGVWFSFPALRNVLVAVLTFVFGRRLRRWAAEAQASVVVSTYPLASVVLGRLRQRRFRPLQARAATFVTDFATHPLWLHSGIDLHLCVHEITRQAILADVGGEAIATGPMVADRFRKHLPTRDHARRQLGIPMDATAVLVVAGSWGVGELESTFDTLAGSGKYFPIVACGSNERLRRRLSARGKGLVLGWTDQMPALMAASDALVQNAGGLTSMEAFAAGLPVVTHNPIPGHGTQNAIYMEQAGVAPYARTSQELLSVLEELLGAAQLRIARARSMFVADPSLEVARLLDGAVPLPLPRRVSAWQRAAVASVTATVAWSGLNAAAGAATALGLGTAHPVTGSPAAYIAVRMGSQALADPQIGRTLAADQVAAVVEGDLAATDPGGVAQLAARGATIIDGGWGNSSGLHLLGQSTLARSSAALEHALGYPCNILAPDQPLNGVDVAIAGIEHIQVLDPITAIPPSGPIPVLLPGHIYVLNIETLPAPQAQARIADVLASLHREGLQLGDVGSLA